MKALALPLLAFALSACTEPPPPSPRSATAPAPSPGPGPGASIQELMSAIVEPSAEVLWNAVSSEVTAAGVEERQPRSDAEWQAVRRHAIALQDAGTQLLVHGRRVVHPGKVTADAGVDGVFTPEQVRAAIERDQPGYDAAARGLRDSAAAALAAIERRDVQGLVSAGERIDKACEACHSVYWYPNAKEPGAAWPAPITPAAAQ